MNNRDYSEFLGTNPDDALILLGEVGIGAESGVAQEGEKWYNTSMKIDSRAIKSGVRWGPNHSWLDGGRMAGFLEDIVSSNHE